MYIILSLLLSAGVLSLIFIRKLRERRFRTPATLLFVAMSLIFAILHFISLPRDEVDAQLDEAEIQGFVSHLPARDKLPARLIFHGPIASQYLVDKLCHELDRPVQPLESVQECALKPDAGKEALVIFFDGFPRSTLAKDLPQKWIYAVFRGGAFQSESYFAQSGFLGFQIYEAKSGAIKRWEPLEGTPLEIYNRYFRFWKGGEFEEFRKTHGIALSSNPNEEEESP